MNMTTKPSSSYQDHKSHTSTSILSTATAQPRHRPRSQEAASLQFSLISTHLLVLENKTHIFQRAFVQMCPPRTATTFLFFTQFFPFKGTKSACKNEREKKKSESKRTNKREGEGRDRTEREGEGAWSLSSRQSRPVSSKSSLPFFRTGESQAKALIGCPKDRALGVATGGARPWFSRSFSWVCFGCGFRLIWGRLTDWWASS